MDSLHGRQAGEEDSISQVSKPQFLQHDKAEEQKLWEPKILQKSSLFAFLVCFLAIAVILPVRKIKQDAGIPQYLNGMHFADDKFSQIMYVMSTQNHGLSTVDFRYHYLCTYGPTAVFTLIMAFWSAVEFRAKQLLPWMLMQKGSTPASQSILIDYVSSWNVIVLFKSLIRKQFLVSLAISGTLLLQLILVMSTGLFFIQSTERIERVPVQVSQAFHALSNNNINLGVLPFAAGYASQNLGLGYPFGTTQYSVFPEFVSKSTHGEEAILAADVDVLTFDVLCEEAEVRSKKLPQYGQLSFDLVTPTCNLSLQWCCGIHDNVDLDYCEEPGARKSRQHEWRVYYYTVDQSKTPPGLPYWSGRGKNETSYIRLSGIICSAMYNVTKGRVAYKVGAEDGIRSTDIQLSKSVTKMLPGITSSGILSSLWSSAFDVLPDMSHWPGAPERKANLSSVGASLRDFLVPTGVQFIKEYLLRPASTNTLGWKTSQQDRLFVRLLSFAVIEGALILLVLVAATIIAVYSPCAVCSTDPSTIGGFAAMIARSEALIQSLENNGTTRPSVIATTVKDLSCQTLVDDTTGPSSFWIAQGTEGSEDDPANSSARANPQDAQSNDEEAIKWWQPALITWPARVSILALSVGLLVALELLYRNSHSNSPRGLATVSRSSTYLRYTWAYIPGLTMLCVQLLFRSLYSYTKLFQPFYALRKGASSAKQSMMDKQLGTGPLLSLWQSMVRLQPAVVSISMAAVLAPFLTIVVSGLLFTQSVNQEQHALISRSFHWDLHSLPNAFGTRNWKHNILPSLVLYSNLSFPARTYGPYVFPAFDAPTVASSKDASQHPQGSKLQATVPALRTTFNCTAVPQESIRFTFSRKSGTKPGYISLTSSYGEQECSNEAMYTESLNMSVPWKYFDAITQSSSRLGDWSPKCPTFMYAFGKLTSLTSPENTSIVYCSPYIEQVETDVTFLLPGYTVDTKTPPQAKDDTAKILYADADKGLYGHPIAPFGFFENPTLPDINTFDAATNGLSSLGKALVYGAGGVPASELLGQRNVENLVNSLERVFGIIMAQLINQFSNNPSTQNSTEAASSPSYNAIVIEPTHSGDLRLIQSVVSTRILEALLAVLSLCAIITFLTIDTRRVLPKDPSSIAAMLSLLAGSKLLKSGIIPPGSEFADEKSLLKIFDGLVFSMGWWETDGKFRFGIDVGERPAKGLEDLNAREKAISFQGDDADN